MQLSNLRRRVADPTRPPLMGIPTADPKRAADWAAKGVRYSEADAPGYLLRQMYADQLAALGAAFAATSGEPDDHTGGRIGDEVIHEQR